jgi:maleylpyruvate isomerase
VTEHTHVAPSSPPPDPDLGAVAAATDRLLVTVAGLDAATARRPSLLPGWTVGHVITHIARNADGMVRLVEWARTGRPTPMYPSVESRSQEIEAGSGRSPADLLGDVQISATRLGVALELLATAGDDALDRLVVFGPPRPGQAPDTPARSLPFARLRELEIHHVDLGLDYRPSSWSPDFVERTLLYVHSRSGAVDVIGDPAEVLAWRIGRGAGPTVRHLDGTDPGDPPSSW